MLSAPALVLSVQCICQTARLRQRCIEAHASLQHSCTNALLLSQQAQSCSLALWLLTHCPASTSTFMHIQPSQTSPAYRTQSAQDLSSQFHLRCARTRVHSSQRKHVQDRDILPTTPSRCACEPPQIASACSSSHLWTKSYSSQQGLP
jgi:hypothetical protein